MKKIKIAHVITRMIIGGAQENTLLSVEGLHANAEYDVDLITGPAIGPEGTLLDRAYKNKISVLLIHEMRRNLNVYYDTIAFIKLYKLFKSKKYDIVHTHSSKAGILARAAAHIANVPVIIHSIHGLAYHRFENQVLNIIYIYVERLVSRWTQKIITVCPEMTRKALAEKVGTPEQYQTIYSGIETERFTTASKSDATLLRNELDIPENALVVGKIARLFYLKGHTYLLPAIKKVIDRKPNTYFLLVGDGILKNMLQHEAKKLGIDRHIRFVGLVKPEEIPRYVQCMDIVVHLSLREGLPRVVPQAFLCKKPVVVYDIDGAYNIVEDGKNGFLIPPKSIDMISEKILFLIENKDVRSKMGMDGYHKAIDLFPYERMVKELDALYKEYMV
ncbi:MAG: glycosyltransferase family 4 protein [Candidatus Omnitrophica bacterium]|nr:glycosyltransferase family 4 protein [Candidatus Omnitrophota bacterium]